MNFDTIYTLREIRAFPKNEKVVICADIDDTLLRADPDVIGLVKYVNGVPQRLTTEEFATDPDKKAPNMMNVENGIQDLDEETIQSHIIYSYEELNNPVRVRNSIIKGTPLLRNLRIVDDYINAGADFVFLTARSQEKVIKDALDDFLRYRDEDGTLHPLKGKFKKELSYAVSDKKYNFIFSGIYYFEKKSKFLRYLCSVYDLVVFLDDDLENIKYAKNLKLPNLKVIIAKK